MIAGYYTDDLLTWAIMRTAFLLAIIVIDNVKKDCGVVAISW